MSRSLFVGLMSGTSVDAVDAAVVEFEGGNTSVLASAEQAIPQHLRQRIASLSHPGNNEIEQMGVLDRELGELFANATLSLLAAAGLATTDIVAIGSHGQTVRHRPPSAGQPGNQSFTLQIGDPNTIAEITGITTIADFRRRDMAAGGEGAPLAPAFHQAAFAKEGVNRAIVNIGGIANASILAGLELVAGFDTGPGNTLLDHWVEQNRGQSFDRDGRWAAGGDVQQPLLEKLLQHPHLQLSGPRSTGKEAFNLAWLTNSFPEVEALEAQAIQATLAEFTAATIAMGLASTSVPIAEIYVCGGGAHNDDLLQRLQKRLAPATVDTTTTLGIGPDQVEAAAFAWLAKQAVEGLPGNAPRVTGAAGNRVLGGIYPGHQSTC